MNPAFRILNWLIVAIGLGTTVALAFYHRRIDLPITGLAVLPAALVLRVLEAPRSRAAAAIGALLNAGFAALGLFGMLYAALGAAAQPLLTAALALLLCALPFGANAVFLILKLRSGRAGRNAA